jgi:hypothetical protein
MINAYFISGTVYANYTGGPRLSYPDVQWKFSIPYLVGGSTSGDVNGTYVLVLPVVTGTSGFLSGGNFTVSASGYNTTIVPANITIGNDLPKDFVLLKSPPPPPPPPSATIMGTILGNAGPELPFSYEWWHLSENGYQFMVGFNTSSYIDFVFSSLSTKSILVSVWGPEGTTGQMTIWIPDAIFQMPFSVTSIPGPSPTMGTQTDNGTYTSVSITYGLSSKTIVFTSTGVIPEFPDSIALMIVLFSVALAILLQKKLRVKTNQQKHAIQQTKQPY